MAVQDLTPQLRTRLSRLERLVGVFVTLAALLLLAGLAYYVYHTAERKGWRETKATYFVYLRTGVGLKEGDPVMLMGFSAGEITKIAAARPWTYDDNGNMVDVYVEFVVRGKNIGYVYNDSIIKVKSSGLLGARFLELTKGGSSGSTNLFVTYKENKFRHLTHVLVRSTKQNPVTPGTYRPHTKEAKYWLDTEEPPDLGSQMDEVMRTAKGAIPAILDLTNQLNRIMNNANTALLHLDEILVGSGPVVTNLNKAMTNMTAITGMLRDTKGALGEWLLPTNIQNELVLLLPNINGTITNVNTNLVTLVSNVNKSLENLAGITGNLNAQVEANTNILSNISSTVVHTDDLIQGLKRHWLLRSAFKPKAGESRTNSPPAPRATSPKGASSR